MANIKAAQKYIRKTATRTALNRSIRSRLRTLAKKVESAAEGDERRSAAIEYTAALDKAAKTGLVHPNKASRDKSKVAKYIFASAS